MVTPADLPTTKIRFTVLQPVPELPSILNWLSHVAAHLVTQLSDKRSPGLLRKAAELVLIPNPGAEMHQVTQLLAPKQQLLR